jgi:hypothetical protein
MPVLVKSFFTTFGVNLYNQTTSVGVVYRAGAFESTLLIVDLDWTGSIVTFKRNII